MRLTWLVVQQRIYRWVNSCMAAFKYLAAQIFWKEQVLQWDWLKSSVLSLKALKPWEGPGCTALSTCFTKPCSKKEAVHLG